jgi:hypothetical protein
MSDAATPAEQNGGTPPAAPAATPANQQPETVTLSKEEHDRLARDAARARSNQSKADRYDRIVGKGGTHFAPQAPATPPSEEERAERAAEEDRKAERGILSLAGEAKYRAVFDADPTLHEMFRRNPLAVLPILAPDALDAEDAMSLITEKLDERLANIKPNNPTPPADDKAGEGKDKKPEVPPAGGVNTQEELPNEEYEAAKKLPGTEQAVAGMIKANLKRMGGKSS